MSDLTWTPVRVRLGQIKPWTHNPRMSTKAQAQRLIKSERELGQPQTLAVSPFVDGFCDLYDGHQRVAAWNTIKGADFEVWALQSNRPLSDDERRKISILLHTATGSWEWDKLAAWSAADLQEWGMDKSTLDSWVGDVTNLKAMLNSEQETQDAEPQIDRAAELLEKWQVKAGDLWQIGEHRILCGDSTKREDVERVMGGTKAVSSITDPPYNVGIDYDNNQSDEQEEAKYMVFSSNWFELARQFSASVIFTPGRGQNMKNLHMWYQIEKPLDMCIWIKKNTTTHGSFTHFMAWEAILVYGDLIKRPAQDIYDYPIINQFSNGVAMTAYHPTPKRLEFWEALMDDFTNKGDVIYEPFGGSGTTLVASENTKRVCRAIELSPQFVAVQLERMSQAFPGIEIKRLDT